MTDRAERIMDFLSDAGWGLAKRTPLAGDASNRRYERLLLDGRHAVLMDAPPEKGEDVRPFVQIAEYLIGIGLSAPVIFARDAKNGLLLIEDLGDDLFSSVTAAAPDLERELYVAATDTLIALHRADPPPNAPDYGVETMTAVAGLSSDWYAMGCGIDGTDTGKEAIAQALRNAFAMLPEWNPVLVLRDFHAENLLWLPERAPQAAKVGLLDFQDAGMGHPAYDLMSLAHDVRRMVQPETRQAMIEHYAQVQTLDVGSFTKACATVSAQRNLRILGVFARLSMHFGKPRYVDIIPAVWSNLMHDLAHPDLTLLRDAVSTHLPEPTPARLNRLKDLCVTAPMP